MQALSAALISVEKARLSDEGKALRQRYAGRAVESLRWAIAAGFHDAALIETEEDFDSLRARTSRPCFES
jgi:hypothetical protein